MGIKINQKDVFPIWGTCLGFESLIFALGNYKLKTFRVKTKNQSIPISWDPVNYPGSVFKKVLRKSVAEAMASTSITYFTHQFAFDKDEFERTPELKDVNVVAFYKKDGRRVAAAIQHKKYPIFGVQFHPEKILFESHQVVKKKLTKESSMAAQELSRILFNYALKSEQEFHSQAELHKYKFTKFVRHQTQGVFESVFLFKKRYFRTPLALRKPSVCVINT